MSSVKFDSTKSFELMYVSQDSIGNNLYKSFVFNVFTPSWYVGMSFVNSNTLAMIGNKLFEHVIC